MRYRTKPNRKPQGSRDVITVSISMEPDLRDKTIAYTQANDTNVSQLVRELLRNALEADKENRTRNDKD